MNNMFFQVIDKICPTQDNRNLWNVTKVRAEYYGGENSEDSVLYRFYLFISRERVWEGEGRRETLD